MTTSLVLEKPVVLDLQGSQEPRLQALPSEVVSSAGQEAVEVARVAGLELDPWERFVLERALGERIDGKWAAFEVGTVVPRQNGKDVILEARELAGLFVFGERLLIHSAHEQATASEHFRRLLELIEGVPEFDSRVLKAPKGKGAEAIELRGGQRILFKTRTGGGGRGLTGDFVVLNEAMILPEATTAALVPTMAAKSINGNPQLWYAGSAVDQQTTEHGLVLARLRARALRGAERVAYFEWSAEGDDPNAVDPDVLADPEVWAQANPGLGIRISVEHVANEHGGALGAREFAIERLGIGDWPKLGGLANGVVIDVQRWAALAEPAGTIEREHVLAFDVSPDRSTSSIAIAGRRADDLPGLELLDRRNGTVWLPDRLVELTGEYSARIVCDQASPAASIVPILRNLGLDVETLSAREYAQACGAFFDAVESAGLRHHGPPELASALASAVRAAARRVLGDAWAWSRRSSSSDITPLVACTLALWGLTSKRKTPTPRFEVLV